MRVHLGSDHAGLELKEHLPAGCASTATSPSTTARSSTTPTTTTRSSACAPPQARGRRRRQPRHRVGGSGNGEQIAANKVRGVRAALAWSEETAALAREHNDANVISVGGRMHAVEDMTRFVEIFLETAVHRRASGTSGGSGCSRRTRRPATCRRCRTPPGTGRSGPMPEGHTLYRLARDARATPSPADRSRPAAPRAGSPSRARCSTGRGGRAAESWRQAPVRGVRAATGSCTCTSA